MREDGTVSLPQIPPLKVEGRSLAEVQADIIKAYTVTKQVLKLAPDGTLLSSVLVSIIKQRQYHILVVREDAGGLTTTQTGFGQAKRGTGYVISLPAYENDVLNALARTGGLPGLDAQNEVIIERAGHKNLGDKEGQLPNSTRI